MLYLLIPVNFLLVLWHHLRGQQHSKIAYVQDYIIFTILSRLHQDYTGITMGLHRDYTIIICNSRIGCNAILVFRVIIRLKVQLG